MSQILIIPTTDPDLDIVIENGDERYDSIRLQRRSTGNVEEIGLPSDLIPWFHQVYPDGSVSIVCFDRETGEDWNFTVDLETKTLTRFAPFK